MAKILAIETSCDETAVAIVENRFVLSNVVSSQIDIHKTYGGIVPEVASRHHVEMLNWAIAQAVDQAGVTWADIDAIAATCAPGLVGALLVGLTAAKTLASLYQKPFLGVHHLEGHIYASYLSEPSLQPPFLCLLVSGGHTSLIHVKDCGVYTTLGQTRDDAAGEAFDKVGRLLKLGYPGGPIIDKLSAKGDPTAFPLPEGNISLPEGGYHPYDSSFSGLKTAVSRLVQKLEGQEPSDVDGDQEPSAQPSLPVADLAASFQATVARSLTRRAIRCAKDFDLTTIAVGGGVAANSGLRQHLQAAAAEHEIQVFFPPLKFCTDNAAMIGCAAADHFDRGHRSSLTLGAQSRMAIADVMNLYA
ncbi:MAG: tRNA (adenosine(37)-N6)-threonylcarbamoyltransferase complex transferase subunit TsaD [Leptolyngbyaceae bacterium]|nr:tRNA (adenosine(37)-N6)-threonylcarbamoyltransferase complex transferase subunit TsaD [Leptolyngbyaceae bacterium]